VNKGALKKMKILITGCAGFIGYHLTKKFCSEGFNVTGLDNINEYYDPLLKQSRLSNLKLFENFQFTKIDICNTKDLFKVFERGEFQRVMHLAAQAGVRYSLESPHTYINSNIKGFLNILEASKSYNIEHLVYASSSSVYGLNNQYPFSSKHSTDHPASLYAATKKSNEMMAHTYSHLFGIPTTGLRFFTVYGPWGRPDMALFKFTDSILKGNKIHVNNNGNMKRDFTYIDDIIEGIFRIQNQIPKHKKTKSTLFSDQSSGPFSIYNIGAGNPVSLMDFIKVIEVNLGIKAKIEFKPMQMGDVKSTHADISELIAKTGYVPQYSLDDGVKSFVSWFRDYYSI
jgi:UDP-glucuronate 4-epimerase